ncbi:MAG: hypothetical protein AB4041_10885 [Microcystaceae cyanobacterium]
MSNLPCLKEAFLHTLIGDDGFYPWNPYDEQTEAFLSEQEEHWDFTQDLSDSEVEERACHLFAQFKDISASTSDSKYNPSNPLTLEQMGKELDSLAV